MPADCSTWRYRPARVINRELIPLLHVWLAGAKTSETCYRLIGDRLFGGMGCDARVVGLYGQVSPVIAGNRDHFPATGAPDHLLFGPATITVLPGNLDLACTSQALPDWRFVGAFDQRERFAMEVAVVAQFVQVPLRHRLRVGNPWSEQQGGLPKADTIRIIFIERLCRLLRSGVLQSHRLGVGIAR